MTINKLWMGLMVMVPLLVCSCEEKNGAVAPVFPTEVVNYTVEPGDEVVVTFSANADWQLSSDAMWCKVDGFLDTTGKAGEQQIAFVISADGQSVDEDKANISLRMGDESKVIAIVTRVGISNAIVLGNDSVDYVHGQTLLIGSEGVASLSIKDITFDANSLYITTTAEWLDIQRDDTVFTFAVKEEYRKYTQNSTTDSVCFSNKEIPMMRLNVQYTGMDANKVSFAPATQWGLTVSVDGTTYREPVLDGTTEDIAAPMQVTVTALNDAYTLYYANYDKNHGCVLVDVTESWIIAEDDKKGGISISFKENAGVERVGYLFVLPDAISEDLTGANSVSDFLLEDSTGIAELKMECEQYLVAEFIQEDALSGRFHLIDGKTYDKLEIALETDEEVLAYTASKGLSANDVFKAELNAFYPYLLNPMFALDVWNMGEENSSSSILVIDKESKEPYVVDEDYWMEPTMMETEGNHMLLQFRLYKETEKECIIFFIDNDRYLKALVVTPNLEW